jgi:hypothetical protein
MIDLRRERDRQTVSFISFSCSSAKAQKANGLQDEAVDAWPA